MGSRGPRPKPAALRLIDGNAGKRAINLDSGLNPLACIPDCPAFLNVFAKKEWKRLAEEMLALGTISNLDRAAFTGYCEAWGDWVLASTEVGERERKLRGSGIMVVTPNGFTQESPWALRARLSRAECIRLGNEFGFTPASRMRVELTANRGQLHQDLLPGMPEEIKKPTLASFNPDL